MSKSRTIKLSLVCILLSLMLVVSCGKKTVETPPADDPAVTDTDDTPADDADDTPMDADTDTSTEEDMAMAAAEDQAKKDAEALAQAEDDFVSIDVYFEYDSSVILDSALSALENKADFLRSNPDVAIIIEGHCDERGTTEYNLALGDRRAVRVKSFLMDLGIDASRIQTISYGEERPVAMGHMESAWAKNRRAHFLIK